LSSACCAFKVFFGARVRDQSALARCIQKLEHSLGFKLLERSTREESLTQAG
jgi:DNA-binding transcriptional LysR family regulator